MQIDITLTDKEINQAIEDYLIKQNLINASFKMIKKYSTLNSYTYSNNEQDIEEANNNGMLIHG